MWMVEGKEDAEHRHSLHGAAFTARCFLIVDALQPATHL